MIEAPMGDARFFARSSPHPLAAIATAAGGTAPAIERMFCGVAPLQSAGAGSCGPPFSGALAPQWRRCDIPRSREGR